MNRRDFLMFGSGVVGVTLTGGGIAFAQSDIELAIASDIPGFGGSQSDSDSGGEHTPIPEEDLPEDVAAVKPLAEAFYARVADYYKTARVFITKNGEIAMDYKTTSESREELQSEFYRIAALFARVAKSGDYTPATLSIITGNIQGIVPKPGVKAYINGDLKKDAFLKTVEITGIKRREN